MKIDFYPQGVYMPTAEEAFDFFTRNWDPEPEEEKEEAVEKAEEEKKEKKEEKKEGEEAKEGEEEPGPSEPKEGEVTQNLYLFFVTG